MIGVVVVLAAVFVAVVVVMIFIIVIMLASIPESWSTFVLYLNDTLWFCR